MPRKLQIGKSNNKITGEVIEYFVTDAQDSDELSIRPRFAVFPVSLLCDAVTQEKRAKKFADYINSIIELTNNLEDEQEM